MAFCPLKEAVFDCPISTTSSYVPAHPSSLLPASHRQCPPLFPTCSLSPASVEALAASKGGVPRGEGFVLVVRAAEGDEELGPLVPLGLRGVVLRQEVRGGPSGDRTPTLSRQLPLTCRPHEFPSNSFNRLAASSPQPSGRQGQAGEGVEGRCGMSR